MAITGILASFGELGRAGGTNWPLSPIDYSSKPRYLTGLVVVSLSESVEAIYRPAKISTLVPIYFVRAGEYVLKFQVQA